MPASPRNPGRDSAYLSEAVTLARRGLGRTRPNPPVGAIVVARGEVVGRGWHRRAGGPHAEIYALRQAGDRARGATLYVTLEPCSHRGRTGPCADAVIAAGCRRVVIGVRDANPQVAGRGIRRLRAAGLDVELARDALAGASRELVRYFSKWVRSGRPWVTLKLATTLDGRIATRSGDSRWVTGAAARKRVHEMRNRLDAVVVGSETVLADDPQLDTRLRGGRDPVPVVLDGRGRVPASARVFAGERGARLYTKRTRSAAARELAAKGVEVRSGGGDRVGSFAAVLDDLGGAGITSVLLEGGGRLAARALSDGCVDELAIFLAPKLVGSDGRAAVGPLGVDLMGDAVGIEDLRIERVGEDWLLQGRLPSPRRSG